MLMISFFTPTALLTWNPEKVTLYIPIWGIGGNNMSLKDKKDSRATETSEVKKKTIEEDKKEKACTG